MSEAIIAMRSETAAVKAQRLLSRNGIRCRIVSVDPAFTSRGCSVGIAMSSYEVKGAEKLLDSANIFYGVVLGQREV